MADDTARISSHLIGPVTEVVAAYISRNHVAAPGLPALIESVHAAISKLTPGVEQATPSAEPASKPTSAQIRRSVQPDAIVSFLDGKPYQTLKRHLTKHGYDPSSYRARFGLPDDYPMTTASYSERRSDLAKASGLGVKGSRSVQEVSANRPAKGRRRSQ